ncbi:MAG TPA: TonB-dependent receptor [Gemmatirosa sp.]|nr:TonB-dependent receptor [Gemmatirosa sp.]
MPALLLAPGAAFAQEAPAPLGGVVVERATGRPVIGAEVLLLVPRDGAPDTLATVRTDDAGRWTLRAAAPGGAARLRVRRVGFVPADLPAPVGGAPLRVALDARALDLDATIVTASRRLQRLADAPVAVNLVTRAELAETGATDLASALTEQAGLPVDGGVPTGQGVMLQGLDSRRVLVLLDGQPMVGRINGMLDLSRLPTQNVERIEIVKGPQSTLYGSDAMGGVVNVITRTPGGGTGGSLGVTSGTQGRRDLSARLQGGPERLGWSADLGRRSVDLLPGVDGDLATRSERWDGGGRVRWTPRRDSSLTIDASTLLLDEGQRWRAGPLYFFADRRQYTGRLGATWARGRTRLQATAFCTAFDHLARRAFDPRPLAGSAGDTIRQRLAVAELFATRALGGGGGAAGLAGTPTLDAGVQLRQESAASPRVPGGTRRRQTAEPYAQASFGGARWSVVPGVRLTADDRWGTHLTPRLAAMLRPATPLALRASVGRGFRVPDFNEQYITFYHADFGYRVQGNAALRPELSNNVSTSAEWSTGRLYLRLDAFENRFRGFIEEAILPDTTGVTFYTYQNVGRGITRGVDAEGIVRLGRVRLEAAAGRLRAFDARTDRPLLNRPASTARLALSGTVWRGLAGTTSAVWTGRAAVALAEDGRASYRDGFLRVNARLTQTLARRHAGEWQLQAGANNLLGARPALWPGFTGRQLYTGLAWNAGVGSGR